MALMGVFVSSPAAMADVRDCNEYICFAVTGDSNHWTATVSANRRDVNFLSVAGPNGAYTGEQHVQSLQLTGTGGGSITGFGSYFINGRLEKTRITESIS